MNLLVLLFAVKNQVSAWIVLQDEPYFVVSCSCLVVVSCVLKFLPTLSPRELPWTHRAGLCATGSKFLCWSHFYHQLAAVSMEDSEEVKEYIDGLTRKLIAARALDLQAEAVDNSQVGLARAEGREVHDVAASQRAEGSVKGDGRGSDSQQAEGAGAEMQSRESKANLNELSFSLLDTAPFLTVFEQARLKLSSRSQEVILCFHLCFVQATSLLSPLYLSPFCVYLFFWFH